jgi:hypothetical protein
MHAHDTWIGFLKLLLLHVCVSAPLSATNLLCMQVERSLVQHLNSSLKAAVDKADDAEAEAVEIKQQVRAGNGLCVGLGWGGCSTGSY